jgi:hypothetical protein
MLISSDLIWSDLSLFWSELRLAPFWSVFSLSSLVVCLYWSELNSVLLLHSASVSTETPVGHLNPVSKEQRRACFRESISMETCLPLSDVLVSKNLSPWKRVLPTRSLAMGLHVTIVWNLIWIGIAHATITVLKNLPFAWFALLMCICFIFVLNISLSINFRYGEDGQGLLVRPTSFPVAQCSQWKFYWGVLNFLLEDSCFIMGWRFARSSDLVSYAGGSVSFWEGQSCQPG